MQVHTAVDERRWLRRVLDDESKSAGLLLAAAVAGLVTAQVWPAFANLITGSVLPVLGLSFSAFAADGLLAIFFFIAGLELRHELTVGTLNTVRAALVPLTAAAAGMALPSLVFSSAAPDEFLGAWGVPMATDLPIALAVVAVFGKRLPLAFRAFLLSLAIADDVGSVLVIAVAFGGDLNVVRLLLCALAVVVYWWLNRSQRSGWLQLSVAVLAWLALLHSGIHPTLLGVVLGMVTTANGDRWREIWQPISSGLCVPLFVFSALAIPLAGFSINPDLASALVGARIIGKTVGVGLGAVLAVAIFRPVDRLPLRQYFTAGAVATLGFSVSMLFAQLSLDSATAIAQVQIAVVIAVLASTVFAAVWLRLFRN